MDIHESLIVGISFTGDSKVLVVGRQNKGLVDVVNAFQGEEAEELYKKLITKKENKGD